MTITIGPAGIGKVEDVEETFKAYKERGIGAAEIPFTYGVYIKSKEKAEAVGKAARKNGIRLSIHAPYWVNLNSTEKKKVEESKQRILACCEVAEWLGAEIVVFHPGYYGKMERNETFQNVKTAVLDMLSYIKEKGWKVRIAAETMGKINVFGSMEEISRLVSETGCMPCVDFAHLLARSNGNMSYGEMYEKVSSFKELHCHFSGIVYGDKGEKNHKKTEKEEWEKLLKALPKKGKDIFIINEAPTPIEDASEGIEILTKLK